MKFIERPLYNLKRIDLKMVLFVSSFMFIILYFAVPAVSLNGVNLGVGFFFSPTFIPIGEVSAADLNTTRLNNLYTFLNISKALAWAIAIILMAGFLFSKPRVSEPTKEES